jgi:hypothetical protein
VDLSLGVWATELVDFAGPVSFFPSGPLQEGEDGHHALESPHTDVLSFRDPDFSAFNEKVVPYKHRLVAITVDPFDRDLQSQHGRLPIVDYFTSFLEKTAKNT